MLDASKPMTKRDITTICVIAAGVGIFLGLCANYLPLRQSTAQSLEKAEEMVPEAPSETAPEAAPESEVGNDFSYFQDFLDPALFRK